jgi:excisionase family DNA binding protein
MSPLMTVREVAELLSVSTRHVQQLVADRVLPSVKLSRKVTRLPRAAVLRQLGLDLTASA